MNNSHSGVMTLFRMVYLREGKPRGTTFAAHDEARASRLAEVWVAGFGGQLLAVKPLRHLQPQLELR